MDIITKDDVKELMQREDGTCVSLFMPRHSGGPDAEQDPIRLKNLLRQTEEMLVARGMRSPDAQALVDPATQLLNRSGFWRERGNGLVIYLALSEMWHYHLPVSLEERVSLDRRLHVIPLLPLITDDTHFFVLALSPQRVRVLSCTRDEVTPVDVPELPESFEAIGQYIDGERQMQLHTLAAAPAVAGAGGRSAIFHGHGGGNAENIQQKYLLEFCRLVDNALKKMLTNESTPLVLACDESLRSIYSSANTYAHLMNAAGRGNPDKASEEQLHQGGWQTVEPLLAAARSQAIDRYHQGAANALATDALEAVVLAADEGRVETLFVALDAQCWGRFDPVGRRVVEHSQVDEDDEELLERAAADTFLKRGMVYALPQNQMPTAGPAAGIFRYPTPGFA